MLNSAFSTEARRKQEAMIMSKITKVVYDIQLAVEAEECHVFSCINQAPITIIK
jgi:hypothetical protein